MGYGVGAGRWHRVLQLRNRDIQLASLRENDCALIFQYGATADIRNFSGIQTDPSCAGIWANAECLLGIGALSLGPNQASKVGGRASRLPPALPGGG